MFVGDTAEQRDGMFDEAGDLIDQAGVIDHRQALGRGEAGNALGNGALAVGGVHQNEPFLQLGGPVVAPGDGKGVGSMEPVPLGQVGTCQAMAIIGAVAQIEGNHRAVQQAGDPAQRADPGEMAGAAPAHGFRPGKTPQQGRERLRDQGRGGDGGGGFLQHPVVAFLANLVAAGVVLAQEASQSLFRCTGAGAALDAGAGGHGFGDIGRQRDPARAMEATDVGRSQGRERFAGKASEVLGRTRLHAGWDFLAEQFQEERGHTQSFNADSMSV